MDEQTQPKRRTAYKAVLDPTAAQIAAFERHCGAQRWAFNYGLAYIREFLDEGNRELDHVMALAGIAPADRKDAATRKKYRRQCQTPVPNYMALSNLWRNDRDELCVNADTGEVWYKQINSRVFVAGFSHADRAVKNWMSSAAGLRKGRRVGFPKFKKKGRCADTFQIVHDVSVLDARHMKFPALAGGVVRVESNLRKLVKKLNKGTARVTTVTVTRRGTRWVAALAVEEDAPIMRGPNKTQRANGTVGVDVGVRKLAVLSTGEIVVNPRHLARAAHRKAELQRQLVRC